MAGVVPIEVLPAAPKHAAGLVELFAAIYRGHYPLSEVGDPGALEAAFGAPEQIWRVAVSARRVVGVARGIANSADNSAELGLTAVLPEFRRHGVARVLCAEVVDSLKARNVDVVWGSLRSEAIRRVATSVGFCVVGYEPGFRKVADREVSLLGMMLRGAGIHQRVRARHCGVYRLPGVANVLKAMNLPESQTCVYPPAVVVGKGAHATAIARGRVSGTETSLEFSSIVGDALPDCMQVTLLADKLQEFAKWQRLGFSLTAFLPGWFLRDGCRYDCIRLTNCLVDPVCSEALEAVVGSLRDEFEFEACRTGAWQ